MAEHEETYEEVQTNQQLVRRFDGVAMLGENAATQAMVAKETASIQARWIMAMKNPRSQDNVRQLMIKECKRPGFADVAIYRMPRGNTTIKGLSIRFAEVAMRCMGNMNCEAQTLFDSPEERVIKVTATDYETNATWTRDITVKKTVERRKLSAGQRALRQRTNSFGDLLYIVEADDGDFRTKEAAEISKASRTAILRLIPGHVQDECFDIMEEIVTKKIASDPDGFKNQVLDAFAAMNVMPLELEKYLGHGLDTASPAEIADLQMVWKAINGGHGVWVDILDSKLTERTSRAAARAATPTKPGVAPQPAKGPAPAPTPAAAATAKPAQTATATTTGKGTQSAKDKIKSEQKQTTMPPASATPPPAESKPEPASDIPDEPTEERQCADCGTNILVPVGYPLGAKCEGCTNA
jgi:hypothetical protein